MNHQPKTAMNDPALQLAVSSVLQLGALKTMFPAKLQGLQTANGLSDLQ